MIAYINGKLTVIQDDRLIVDVSGIGYEIICGNPFIFQAELNEDIFVYTYHHVREDATILYGFKTEDEKLLFTKLISVSGIGPKSGIAILGSVDVGDFIAAVEHENEKYLTQFPGVGKKTARQIILDLKGKLTNLTSITTSKTDHPKIDDSFSENLKEAQAALKSLGYSAGEIRLITSELQKDGSLSTDELIRKALALLMKK